MRRAHCQEQFARLRCSAAISVVPAPHPAWPCAPRARHTPLGTPGRRPRDRLRTPAPPRPRDAEAVAGHAGRAAAPLSQPLTLAAASGGGGLAAPGAAAVPQAMPLPRPHAPATPPASLEGAQAASRSAHASAILVATAVARWCSNAAAAGGASTELTASMLATGLVGCACLALYALARPWYERHHVAVSMAAHAGILGVMAGRAEVFELARWDGRSATGGPAALHWVFIWVLNNDGIVRLFFALAWQLPLGCAPRASSCTSFAAACTHAPARACAQCSRPAAPPLLPTPYPHPHPRAAPFWPWPRCSRLPARRPPWRASL